MYGRDIALGGSFMERTMNDDVERVAMASAFSIRQPNDVSADAVEYWDYTNEAAKNTWRVAIKAAISAMPPQEVGVQEAARVLLDAWDDHGEGLIGELSCYSPLCDMDYFQMESDIDGEWVKQENIISALRELSEKPHG